VTAETDREAFLAGQRPDDIHIYLHDESVSDPDALADYGDHVEDGIVLVLDGAQARTVFQRATGIDPMGLAREAMDTEGAVARDCADATCPVGGHSEEHHPRFIFAFAEAQNEDAGGLYAQGPVIHAYVACTCGERYSDRWVVDAEH